MEDNALKKVLFRKCLLTLSLYLFFTVIFPFPIVSNVMIVKASSNQEEQSEIKLNVQSKSLVKDTSYALKIYNSKDSHKVTYKTSSSSIASVDENGLITAIDFGTTSITVTVKDGFKTIASLQCDVTVGPPAFNITLTKNEVTLSVERKTSLTAILKPNNTVEEAKFSSNDSSIASVSPGGRITAKKVGVTYIFATIDNGKFDMCKVTVLEKDLNDNTNTEESSDSE